MGYQNTKKKDSSKFLVTDTHTSTSALVNKYSWHTAKKTTIVLNFLVEHILPVWVPPLNINLYRNKFVPVEIS